MDSCNNESFLPATVRYGLARPHSHDAASSCNQPATLGLTESFNATYGYVDVGKREAQVAVFGWTPLHWAANYGHAEAIKLLASARESGGFGANTSATDWQKMTGVILCVCTPPTHPPQVFRGGVGGVCVRVPPPSHTHTLVLV